jgi:WD40 repeat protein
MIKMTIMQGNSMKFHKISRQTTSVGLVWIFVIFLLLFSFQIQAQNQGAEVRSIAWSPDGSQIALGGGPIFCNNDPDTNARPYGITILDATTRQPVATFEGHVCAVNSVAWNFDGSKLASTSDDGTARVWDTTTGQLLSVLQDSYGRGVRVTGLAWSPDGSKLAHFVDLGRSPVTIWNPNTGETLDVIDVANDVESLAWSPDGGKLAVGNFNKTVQILDVETGQILNTFDAFDQDGRVASVDWSPDGRKLAISGIGLRILDAQTGQLLLSFQGHTGDSTIFVAWSPDGIKLASVGGLDNSVRIWDTETGLQSGVFPTQQLQLFSVTWSPDGGYLAYATSGDAVQIIPTPHLATPTTASMPTQRR